MGPQLSFELELKLHVPEGRAREVEHALSDPTRAQRQHLQATYYDTPDDELAAAKLAWRVRREGRHWVQTLKGPAGDDGMRRQEYNVPRTSRTRPDADPALHAGTPAGDRLAEVLHKSSSAPGERFRTDVWRRERVLRVRTGTVAIAFDSGVIAAGDASTPVCEVEIELVSGSAKAVIETARKWVTRYGLWIDTINKAQRGLLLAQGAEQAAVATARRPALDASMSLDAGVREMVRACLVPMLHNTSALAAGLGGIEHVHQARVAMRKLRTVVRVFGPYSPAVDPTWNDRLGDVATRLGARRDRDVLTADWLPALAAAGAPPIHLSPVLLDEPGDVVRRPEYSLLALELLEYVHGSPVETAESLLHVATRSLRTLRRHALRRHERFTELAEDEQHTVRKRLKRLRYVAELTAALFPAKQVKQFERAIRPAQEALGTLNDLSVARDLFRSLADDEPHAWFAVGWLTARRAETLQTCSAPLHEASTADRYWRTP